MKVLLVATSIQQTTGYAKVSKYLLRELKKHHQVCHFAFQKNEHSKEETFVPTYESGTEEQGFGFSKLQNAVDFSTPDVIILYNDPIVIATFLKHLKTDAKILVYYDLPYDGVNRELLDFIDQRTHLYYVMTPKTKKFLEHATKKPIIVLPHGVDHDIFKQTDFVGNNPEYKTFINVNRNSQRKRLDITIQAFLRYLKAGHRGRLLLVTDSRGFYDIPSIIQIEAGLHGIKNADITFVDTSKKVLSDADINDLYNQADVNLNTSDGEGFGLSVAESSAVGLSQVITDVGDYSSFADATVVPAPLHHYLNNQAGILAKLTTPDLFAEGMAKDPVPPRKQKSWTEALEPLISSI
jgi:glycosyltransferase involved in cell wall biosynthesis